MLVPVGPFVREITTPTRANGARITLTRGNTNEGWPDGALFDWRVYERDRNGSLHLITQGGETGGTVTGKDGSLNPPLVIELTWPVDKDKDVIRFEADVFQEFNTTASIEWL